MSQKREPSASPLSTQPAGGGYRRQGGSAAPTAPRQRSDSRGGGKSGGGLGTNLLLVVLVAGLGVAGWFLFNQHALLQQSQQALADSDARIRVLEDRLRVTDEALTETGADTSEKINFWESEIRKLWAVSNERNRKWIKANEAGLSKQGKDVQSLSSAQSQLKSAVDRHDKAFAQQQTIIDQLAAMELQFQQVTSGQRDLVDKVNAAQQTVSGLRSDLAGRVTENEQAVAAIDAYRVQLNNRMSELERRLSAVSGSAGL